MELRAVCDLQSSAPEFQLAMRFHQELATECQDPSLWSSPSGLTPLIDKLNELATEALSIARSSFCSATSLHVRYLLASDEEVNQLPDLDLEGFLSSDVAAPSKRDRSARQAAAVRRTQRELGACNPWNVHFGPITAAPMSLRAYDLSVQRRLIEIVPKARVVHQYVLDVVLGRASSDDVRANANVAGAELDLAREHLPVGSIDSICAFDFAMSAYKHGLCFPRTIGSQESVNDLLELASGYAFFGSVLRFPHGAALLGDSRNVKEAERLWKQFESAGRALQVLAGWIRGLTISGFERTCSICYRHVASRVRCAEHATKSHETREGRLAKHVRPGYLRRLEVLITASHIRDNLRLSYVGGSPSWSDFAQHARRCGIRDDLIARFAELAVFLRAFRDLLNQEQADEMEHLFCNLLQQARSFAALPEPSTGAERKSRDDLYDSLRDLISPPGFFKAWFTGRTPLLAGPPPPARRGFDTRHPIARNGAVDSETLRRQVLMQRAWDEATREYRARAMPDAQEIRRLREEEGLSYAKIGSRFGLSHESIRTALRRRSGNRARNRLV
jgi:hypothetical protein